MPAQGAPVTPIDKAGNVIGTSAAPVVTQSQSAATPWNYAPPAAGITNTTTAVTIKTAAGANVRNFLQSIQVTWTAQGAANELVIRDGAGGPVLYRIGIPSGSPSTHTPFFGVPLRGSVNTLLEVALTVATTGNVFINAQGYTGA